MAPHESHWSKATSALSFPADAHSLYSNRPLYKRRESSDLEPTLLAIPLVIILVIGLVSLLVIAHKNREKEKSPDPDPEGGPANGRDKIELQKSRAHVETMAAAAQTPTPPREQDDTPTILVEHVGDSYRPTQPQASEIDAALITGTPQPTRGPAVSRSPLPEADDGAAAVGEGGGGEGQQLHVPEVDGVPVSSIQEALEMDSGRSPVPVRRPELSEADGRAVVGELPGAEEQMAHELDGAKRV